MADVTPRRRTGNAVVVGILVGLGAYGLMWAMPALMIVVAFLACGFVLVDRALTRRSGGHPL